MEIQTQCFCICVPKHNHLQYLFHMLLSCMPQQQIYKLVHMHIWQNYISTNTSYELIAINNFTISTGLHTFHTSGLCPWTNMSTTLHIIVLLHYHCSIHIEYTLKSKKTTATSLHNAIAIYMPTTSMPLKCHICKKAHKQIRHNYVYTCASYIHCNQCVDVHFSFCFML